MLIATTAPQVGAADCLCCTDEDPAETEAHGRATARQAGAVRCQTRAIGVPRHPQSYFLRTKGNSPWGSHAPCQPVSGHVVLCSAASD